MDPEAVCHLQSLHKNKHHPNDSDTAEIMGSNFVVTALNDIHLVQARRQLRLAMITTHFHWIQITHPLKKKKEIQKHIFV